MEAGYDYLLTKSRLQQRFFRISGILLVVFGTILVGAAVAYFTYAYKAKADLDDLNYAVTVPQAISESAAIASEPAILALSSSAVPVQEQSISTAPLPLVAQEVSETPTGLVEPTMKIVENPAPSTAVNEVVVVSVVSQPPQAVPFQKPAAEILASAIAAQQLYPGEAIKAAYWSEPLGYEPLSYIEASLLQGFRPVDSSTAPLPGALPAAKRVIIPSIGVDSKVRGLEILNLGDSRAYETPKNVVGQIMEEANPGELGSVWLFGHLESPIAGEGSVFSNLPEIPALLRKGQEVYVIVEGGSRSYLYRITETLVVRPDELKLDYGYLKALKPDFAQLEPGGANIHMVVCVPRLVYNSRLIVSGQLVGVRS